MVSFNIKIIQDGIVGQKNKSSDDLELNKRVTLIALDDDGYKLSGHSFNWELISWAKANPTTEAPILYGTNTNSAYFTPLLVGTYLLKITIDGKYYKKIAAAIKTNGFRYPCKLEGDQFDLNWSYAVNNIVKDFEDYGFYSTVSNEIYSLSEKTNPIGKDIVLIESNDDGYKNKTLFRYFPTGKSGFEENAIHDNIAQEISDIDEKLNSNNNDLLIIEDSDDDYSKKKIKIDNIDPSSLQYVEENYEGFLCYVQLDYIPYDALNSVSNKIIQVYINGNILWPDTDLNDDTSWYFDSSINCIIFNNTINSLTCVICYYTDGTIFSGGGTLPECNCYFRANKIINWSGQDSFGFRTSISGNFAIIGIDADSYMGFDAGSAAIYERIDGQWTYLQKIVASDASDGDRFGWAVDIDGYTCIVGAYLDDGSSPGSDGKGAAYVFVSDEDSFWTEQQKLTLPVRQFGDNFGWSVTVKGDTCAVGAYHATASNDGVVAIFNRTDTTWTISQEIYGSGGEQFGQSVDMYDESNIIIGANKTTTPVALTSGSAYIYILDGVTWTMQQQIYGDYLITANQFGFSVSLYEDICIVGAHNPGFPFVYTFTRSGSVWSQQQRLKMNYYDSASRFGTSVSIYDNLCLVGDSYYNDRTGKTTIFRYIDGVWEIWQELNHNFGTYSQFGWATALEGQYALVGAWETNSIDGAAIFYECYFDDLD